ncbi:hypothetical protein [Brachybacterium sp. EE-P12]|uniref:hypothetical protein n=1 Tax=Brachybacterium sp. EE-P12 TaxID=2306299 RepID=UPI000F097F94|nr:hypothetical protein [Brachybacterium sp. EE-P12]
MHTVYAPRHPVPVADYPSDNAATYAEVRSDAERVSLAGPFIDDDTPVGHFGIVVSNMGGVQTYWFKGSLGDANARVVARTQIIRGRPIHYVGGSFFGGTLTLARDSSRTDERKAEQ